MEKKYTFEEMKRKHEMREHAHTHALTGSQRHELLFSPYHVNPMEYRTLAFLYFREEEVEPSIIADSLGIQRQTMTRILDGLEKKKYVTRKVHPTDRRRVHIQLLPEGEKLARELVGIETAYADAVEKRFSPEEMKLWREMFWRMQKARDEVMGSFLEMRDHVAELESMLSSDS